VSIKVWEEENSEYKSWKLIVDQHDPASCWSERLYMPGAYLIVYYLLFFSTKQYISIRNANILIQLKKSWILWRETDEY
jgi:hypothetical protein